MIKVFQIPFKVGENMSESTFAYGFGQFDVKKNIDKYVHVATLDAADLNEAFEIGNIGPEEKYTRIAPMHSVSVGDILEMDGVKYVVASAGFDKIEEQAAPVKGMTKKQIVAEIIAKEGIDSTTLIDSIMNKLSVTKSNARVYVYNFKKAAA